MKKFFVVGIPLFILFMYVLQISFFSGPPTHLIQKAKSNRWTSRRLKYNKKLSARFPDGLHIQTDIQLQNDQAVYDAINEEIEELKTMGVDIDDIVEHSRKVPHVSKPKILLKDDVENSRSREEHDAIDKLEEKALATISTTNTESILKRQIIGNASLYNRFRIRNPEPEDLLKLTLEGLAFEKVSDPLPESPYCKREVFLTILVVSQPSDVERRRYIRDTWAHSYEDDYQKLKGKQPFPNGKSYIPSDVVRVVFVVGQSNGIESNVMQLLQEESRLSKDIVLGSMTENYRNLTLKTKLGLKWAYYECKTSYVLKTDDDVFVNPVVLVEWLKEIPKTNLYTGWCNFDSPVVRDKKNKW